MVAKKKKRKKEKGGFITKYLRSILSFVTGDSTNCNEISVGLGIEFPNYFFFLFLRLYMKQRHTFRRDIPSELIVVRMNKRLK